MYKEHLVWILGLVLVIAVAYGYYQQRNIHGRYLDLKRNQSALEKIKSEVNELEARVNSAKATLQRLKEDPLEIEAAIRKERRMARDGEIIFHIESPPQNSDQSHDSTPQQNDNAAVQE